MLSPGSFVMPSPFPFVLPYSVAPPPMPEDLTSVSIEELKKMEGNTRKSIEERLKV